MNSVIQLYGGLVIAATALSVAAAMSRRPRTEGARRPDLTYPLESAAGKLSAPLERVGDEAPYSEAARLPGWLGKRYVA